MQLSKQEIEFIQKNKNKPLAAVALQLSGNQTINRELILNQINGLQKIGSKIPTWRDTGILFPVKVSLEQCSSEATARYKAIIAQGDRLIDGTGGFGTDTFFLSENFKRADYFELNAELSKIVAHNFSVLGRKNVHFHNGNSIDFLIENEIKADWIYLDPARRDEAKKKVFLIEDCTPDVKTHLDLLLNRADNILVKLSPIMDIKAVAKQLRNVREFWIIAVKNEVKELLFHIGQEEVGIDDIKLSCIDLQSETLENTISFSGNLSDMTRVAPIGKPSKYLYEPGRAVLKAGLQDKAAFDFSLQKLEQNSNFYTSPDLKEAYPGRIFTIDNQIKAKPKIIKKHLSNGKANIIARNFPMKASQIYEKFKIVPGGDTYLIATSLEGGEKVVFVCKRLK
ncbi:MAG: hypothetical protein ACI85O_000251 [Saprospiraceae bacterium]|jgi:hypothetical protein